MEYVPSVWQDYLGAAHRAPSRILRSVSILPTPPFPNPLDHRLSQPYPASGNIEVSSNAGADHAETAGDHLDPNGVERAVLCHDLALPLPAVPDSRLAHILTQACNDWTLDNWLGVDQRLYATVLVPTQIPEKGAAEIRRHADNPRIVAALIGGNGLGKPFGHEIYTPLYAAAAETGLPIIIVSGGEATTDVLSHPTAGGSPATFSDYYVLGFQSLMTHLVSLIGQGVFEEFRDLKVLFVGGGVGWIVPEIWRFETDFAAFRRDAPWLTQTPRKYLENNVRLSTWPLDRADSPERIARLLQAEPGLDDVICYCSGYPNWDSDTVEDVRKWLPAEWMPKVLRRNSEELFRWQP